MLHPTSLAGGDVAAGSGRWLDFMAEAGLAVWQTLPLVIPDGWGSPYQSCSAFAIDTEMSVCDKAVLDGKELAGYRERQGHWLEDFALYRVLSRRFPGLPWWHWPPEYARREPAALDAVRREAAVEIDRIVEGQCRADRSWQRIRGDAESRGIALFGDMPIFVAHESADVWSNPGMFLLDEDFQPRYVAGVPPDYFAANGQRWGNPHYDWVAMRADGFAWWCARLRRQLEWFGLVRVDHFRALVAVWMIEASCPDATVGFWRETPGRELLAALQSSLGELPLVAEDLGTVTDDVRALRRDFSIPGMAVLQFAFDGSPHNPHLPDNIEADTVVYTGTHDNDTCVGWYASLDEHTRRLVGDVLGRSDGDIAWTMIESAFASRATLAVAPMQDYLGLDGSARMNTPGVREGNWRWRLDFGDLDSRLAERIRDAVERSQRSSDG